VNLHAREREHQAASGGRMRFYVAYGMGVDSTAMLVGLHARGLRPDLIMFADTGGEHPETYAFREVVQAWLADRGWPAITTVRYRTLPTTGYDTLEGECRKNEVLPGLVFNRGTCSSKWKQDAQLQFLRTNRPEWLRAFKLSGTKVVRAIGYDNGDRDRARSTGRACKDKGATLWRKADAFENWYPLQEWGWDRARCAEEITRAGLPMPRKSACFFCPASTDEEIIALGRDHPDLLERALAMEARARSGRHKVGEKGSIQGLAFKRTWASIVGRQYEGEERERT
jgi:hypothetical protein